MGVRLFDMGMPIFMISELSGRHFAPRGVAVRCSKEFGNAVTGEGEKCGVTPLKCIPEPRVWYGF